LRGCSALSVDRGIRISRLGQGHVLDTHREEGAMTWSTRWPVSVSLNRSPHLLCSPAGFTLPVVSFPGGAGVRLRREQRIFLQWRRRACKPPRWRSSVCRHRRLRARANKGCHEMNRRGRGRPRMHPRGPLEPRRLAMNA
jgi:hypothetical protein